MKHHPPILLFGLFLICPALGAPATETVVQQYTIRIRPLRLQIQYNSWFDYGGGVSRENFVQSVGKIHEELVDTRGNRPLSAYVIDDGWQAVHADWSNQVWTVNHKFDLHFAEVRSAIADAGSQLGLWLSPGCLFGARRAIPRPARVGLGCTSRPFS